MSRIKIVLRDIEIEYEGEQSFIEGSLLTFTENLMSIAPSPPPAFTQPVQEPANNPVTDMSTNTIAQIIGAKTGTDLALAAIARLNIVLSKSAAQRQEILDEMKEAPTYYKETYASNFSSYLNTLVKSRKVNLVAKGNYALAANERARLEDAVANGH